MPATELSSRSSPRSTVDASSGPDGEDHIRSVLYGDGAILALTLTVLMAISVGLVVGGGNIESESSGLAEQVEVSNPPTTLARGVESAATTVVPPESCSAAGYASSSDQTGWPEAVGATREAILAAAADCDIQGLSDLTDELFTASFGGGDAVTLWTEAEARGEQPLRILVELLDQPYGVMQSEGGEFYAWPRAFLHDNWNEVPEAERIGLATVYSQEELDSFSDFGAYVGYRIAIHETGDWVYFVAGD